MSPRQPTVIDLFCGAGGFSLGFHAAGARILAAVDTSVAAGRSYCANFERLQPHSPPEMYFGDAGNLESLELERVYTAGGELDVLVGGPPCQGFSRLGRAKLASLVDGEDPRNDLYRRFVQAARLWRPRAVVMENVPGMLSLRGANVADAVASELAGCGYRVGYAQLNAVWFGVPQFRERLFFIGLRDDLKLVPSVPAATHHVELPAGYLRPSEGITLSLAFVPRFELELRMVDAQHPATTVWDALGDLPRITEHLTSNRPRRRPDEQPTVLPYERAAGSPFACLMRRWPGLPDPGGVTNHTTRYTPRDFETFRRMPPDARYPDAMRLAEQRFEEACAHRAASGENLEEGSPDFQQLRKSIIPPYPITKFVDKWRKLNSTRPSWTVPAHLSHDTYSHIHYDSDQARTISAREAARLQSFPDAFEFHGSMGDCYTQIGNAVPPVLAWAIAANLLRQLGFMHEPFPLGVRNSPPLAPE